MPARRRGLLAALAAGVTLAHLWLAGEALPPQLGGGAGDRMPDRLAVQFVRQLAPAAPAPRTARPPARRLRRLSAAGWAEPAASAASAAPLAPLEPIEPIEPIEPAVAALDALPPAPQASTSAAAAAAVAAAAVASAASAPAFDWPPSTRLRYRLSGNYRGPVEGQASVEWRRVDSHYQVFMDVAIGPPFAPLITRHVGSSGEITAQGLSPRRYDEETRVLLREPRHLTVRLDPDLVHLANGLVVLRPPGVQDSASQFVQLTWLFTTDPGRLRSGQTLELPLALPRQVEPWTYEVLASETLDTPAGPVAAVHVKPRREPHPGHELTAEMWIAPSLQYLPVRIVIRQDAETFVDLLIDRLPEQAAPGR